MIKNNKKLPRINEIVNFLDDYDTSTLESLRTSFPNHLSSLKTGITMSADDSEVQDDEIKFRLSVAQALLKSAYTKADSIFERLKKKLKTLNSIQLTSQIIALLSGAAILSIIEKDLEFNWIKYIPPILVLLASILTIYSKNKAESFLGGTENLYDLTNELIGLNVEAKSLLSDIDVTSKFFSSEKAMPIIISANKLAKDMSKIIKKAT